jgi:hypothetical protein
MLAQSSPVLDAIVISNMKEGIEGCMEIKEFSQSTVHKMLQFIYDEKTKVDGDLKMVEELIQAADMYQIQKLKVVTLSHQSD